MKDRYSPYDVTTRVNVMDPDDVKRETRHIFESLYPGKPFKKLEQAFEDFKRLFWGHYPGYEASDTHYHDIQHSLDAALAMVRLMSGYERTHGKGEQLGLDRFTMGFIVALFHDSGYIRKRGDRKHSNGAAYTRVHVTRSGKFLQDYLRKIGLSKLSKGAAMVVHYTGYEVPLDRLALPHPKDRMLGCMLGTADLLAQMADRCYLEKIRDRLYPEFVVAGIARQKNGDGTEHVIYSSAEHLLLKTPEFYLRMRERMEVVFGGVYRYAADHFGGRNLYLEEMENNMRYLHQLISHGNLHQLRRIPLNPPGLSPLAPAPNGHP
jgi:hypothetical protein